MSTLSTAIWVFMLGPFALLAPSVRHKLFSGGKTVMEEAK